MRVQNGFGNRRYNWDLDPKTFILQGWSKQEAKTGIFEIDGE